MQKTWGGGDRLQSTQEVFTVMQARENKGWDSQQREDWKDDETARKDLYDAEFYFLFH